MSCGLWDSDSLVSWLTDQGVDINVVKKFKEQKFNAEEFCSLDREKLIETIGKVNDKHLILDLCLKCIDQLRRNIVLRKSKVFQDSIHGPIELHPLLVKIIDTPQFQRLRDIKQLGGVYHVYPCASHNRFEHSIGVCYLAGEFIKNLCKHQPELGITECDILCVKIAALCHDMGHGPYSHLYQDLFIPSYGKKWKHEDTSVKLMEYMLNVNKELYDKFKQFGLVWEKEKDFLKELIFGIPMEGNREFTGRERSKHFLYEIVANKIHGVDVDKMDYLLRDSHALGITVHFDWKRYVKFARVIKSEKGEHHICSRNKEARDVYELFNIRDRLFRAAYQHKTKRAVEFMLLEVMKKANDYITIPGKDKKPVKMSEAINDMEAFTKLTDCVINAIAFHSVPNGELRQAQEILEEIQKRHLYMFIAKTLPASLKEHTPMDQWPRSIVECRDKSDPNSVHIDESLIKAEVVKFNYGHGSQNPVDKMWFYTKEDLNKPVKIKREQVSSLLPQKFEEEEYHVYYMKYDPKTREAVKIAFERFCKSNKTSLAGGHKRVNGTPSPSPDILYDDETAGSDEWRHPNP